MEEEIIDEDIFGVENESKRFALWSLVLGLIGVVKYFFMLSWSYDNMKVGDSFELQWYHIVVMLFLLIVPPIGLLLSYMSRRRKENAMGYWRAGLLLNIALVIGMVLAIYFDL